MTEATTKFVRKVVRLHAISWSRQKHACKNEFSGGDYLVEIVVMLSLPESDPRCFIFTVWCTFLGSVEPARLHLDLLA